MKRKFKKLTSALLCAALVIAFFPVGFILPAKAYAAGDIVCFGSYPQTMLINNE